MSYIDPSKRLDWLTPRYAIEGWVLPVLKTIDVDGCANAASVVPAEKHYYGQGTKGDADDGYRWFEVTVGDYDAILVCLIAEVASAYTDYRTFQQRLEYARRNVQIQESSLGLAEEKADA